MVDEAAEIISYGLYLSLPFFVGIAFMTIKRRLFHSSALFMDITINAVLIVCTIFFALPFDCGEYEAVLTLFFPSSFCAFFIDDYKNTGAQSIRTTDGHLKRSKVSSLMKYIDAFVVFLSVAFTLTQPVRCPTLNRVYLRFLLAPGIDNAKYIENMSDIKLTGR